MPAQKSSSTTPRVVRFSVDSSSLGADQQVLLDRHAGTARLAWNWALGLRNAYEELVRDAVAVILAQELGTDDADARSAALSDPVTRTRVYGAARADVAAQGGGQISDFSSFSLLKKLTVIANAGEEPWSWWVSDKHGVSRYAISTALQNLDKAIERYYKIMKLPPEKRPRLAPRRKPRTDGRPDYWPQFKPKSKTDPAFALFRLSALEEKLLPRGNRIKLPNLGTIRVHDDLKILRRMIRAGGVPKSARFTSKAGKWYVAINVSFDQAADFVQPRLTTKNQRKNGHVGISLGIAHAATLSNGVRFDNPRVLARAEAKKVRLQQLLSKQQGPIGTASARKAPSKAWIETKKKLARLEAKIALERKRETNTLTKALTTQYESIAIKNIDVIDMTAYPEAIDDGNGGFTKNEAQRQSRLTKGVLDIAFGEIVRQLDYKSEWYGSAVLHVDEKFPSARTCSNCGFIKAEFPVEIRVFECESCGFSIERALNAAINVSHESLRVLAKS